MTFTDVLTWIYGRNPLGLSVRHIRKTGENGEKKLFSVT